MNSPMRIKKIAAVALAALFILATVSTAILKIYATNKANGSGDLTAAGGTASSQKVAEYEKLFKKDGVIDIKIDIGEEDWKSILANPTAEEYKSAKVTVDGITLENVGFRTKGNLTLKSVANSSSDRYSFRIKMDKYVKGQKLLGLDELVVNNMYSDPSYLREYLSYEALKEAGADVPETVFANIYINGELFGFYLCVEAIDDSFLERNFGDDSGNLYKQEQGSQLQYVEGSNYDRSELKSGEDETKADLKNFIKILNEMPQGQKGDIESVLDVDSALRYIAANTVLGNYDSYNGNMSHNYYLYGQEGKFTVIPWDYNMSIAGFGGGNLTTIPIDEPVSGANIKNLPLINNLLAVEEYKTKYHEYIQEYLDYLSSFEERVAELSAIIRPYIEADPTKFYTLEQFEASIKYSEKTAETTEPNTATNPAPNFLPDDMQNNMGGQNQMPQDMPGGFPNDNRQMPPQGDMGGNMRNRPDGMGGVPNGDMGGGNMNGRPNGGMGDGNMMGRPNGGMGGGNMMGGPGGGMGMNGNSTSIINYIRDRVENIKKQLAGELPTTGNTTMNNTMGGNRNNK